MALLFMDGFEAGDWSSKWSNTNGGASSTITRFSTGRSLYFNSSNVNVMKSFSPTAKIIVGLAVMRSTLSSSYEIVQIRSDSTATTHLSLFFSPTGSLILQRGSTVIATSPIELVSAGSWSYIEMSATIADAGGRATVRVNNTIAIDFTGDTKNAGASTNIDAVYIAGAAGQNTYIDDVYICDATGPAPYNDFLGDVRVLALTPDGAGSSTDFTPSTGANYTTVDELPYSATDYVTATASGSRDLYTMSDLPSNYTVLAVQNNVVAKKTDAGNATLRSAIKSGATTYYSPTMPLYASDRVVSDLRVNDPATGTSWTINGVNSLEAGMEVS